MTAPADVVVVYRVTRHLTEQQLWAERACLSDDEQARAERYVFADDRRDYIAAHALLRQTLSERAPCDPRSWTFSRGAHGKPLLAGASAGHSELTFNVSHTRGLVACIVSRHVDVGIDVERVTESPDALDIARERFSAEEVSALIQCDPSARGACFTELWTLKEAYAKATGKGVLGGMSACTFRFGPGDSLSCEVEDGDGPRTWLFGVFEILDYRLAVAVRENEERGASLSIRHAPGSDGAGNCNARLLRRSTGVVVA